MASQRKKPENVIYYKLMLDLVKYMIVSYLVDGDDNRRPRYRHKIIEVCSDAPISGDDLPDHVCDCDELHCKVSKLHGFMKAKKLLPML